MSSIQLANAAGAEVLTTASTDEKVARLRELGAAHGINYRTSPLSDAVQQAIGPNKVDLVIDPVGGKVLQESVSCLNYRGRIVNLGFAGRDSSPFNPLPLWGRNGALIGLSLTTSLRREYDRTYAMISECIDRVARGELRVIIGGKFRLAEAARAHAEAESRTVFGRVVMLPTE